MRLEGKVAFISGAGGGMGREVALMFAKEGAKIVANDYRPEAVEETVKLVQQQGGKAIAVPGDVANSADVKHAIELGEEKYGKINILYNNAGVMPDADESVTDMTDEIWERVLNINAKDVAHCCQYGIPALLRAGGGSVVNIASFVSLIGCSIPQDAYTASKGAVLALAHSLADLAKWALRLNRIPMGGFRKASDIVDAGIYLASDGSTWVNGANLVVDGGITVNYF